MARGWPSPQRRRWAVVLALTLAVGCTRGQRSAEPTAPGPVGGAATAEQVCDARFLLDDGRQADLRVFLAPGADVSVVSSIRELLGASPAVVAFEHRDEDAAWAEFEAMFADRPDMLSAVGREDIPSAFLVIAVEGGVDGLRSELHEVAGVRGFLAATRHSDGDCVSDVGEGDGG